MLVMDELVVRTGLRMLLESWPEMRLVAETGRTADALALALSEAPDVALYDIGSVFNEANREFLSELIRSMGVRATVALAGDDDPNVRLTTVRMGVNGVVYKGKAVDELRKAILKVSLGEMWLDRASTARFILQTTRPSFAEKPDPVKARIAALTGRERQVASLICQGLQNEEVGKRLLISETTVRHHLTSIFSKIGVSNRLELTVFLYRNNFTGTPC